MEVKKVTKSRKRVLCLFTVLRTERASLRAPVFKSDRYEFYNFRSEVDKCRKQGRLDMNELSEKAIAFVESNDIDIVLALSDDMTLLQGILSVRFPNKIRGPSLESSFLAIYKYYARELFDTNPIPFCSIELDSPLTEDELKAKAAKVGFPAFLKPSLGTYSQLGMKVNSLHELSGALEDARKHYDCVIHDFIPLFARYLDVEKFPLALKKGMILEKYMDVPGKATVDGYVFNGKVTHWAITDWAMWPTKREVPQQMLIPSTFPEETQTKIWQTYDVIAHRLIQLGFDNQFLNMEFFLCEDGDVRLQEINARMATLLIPNFLFVMKPDPMGVLLDILQGEEPRAVEFTGKHSSHVCLTTLESGKLPDIIDVELALSMENFTFDVKSDAEIKVFSDGGTTVGSVLLFGDSREDILKQHKELRARLFKKDPYQLGY